MNWFDEEAWYPLGRIVGGTVYPGMFMLWCKIVSTADCLFRTYGDLCINILGNAFPFFYCSD